MNKKCYLTSQIIKFIEGSIYVDGTVTGTSRGTYIDVNITGHNAQAVINQVVESIGGHPKNVEKNCDNHMGLAKIFILENGDGKPLSDREFAQWRLGQIKAYKCEYSFWILTCRVEKI